MKAIMRCKKLSSMGSVASSLQHCYRERETPNAVPDRTPQNEHGKAKTTDEAMGRLRDLLPAKRRKDAVLAVEYVMTASPEWWEKASKAQQLEFFNQSHKWLASKYGKDNVFVATIHRDETSPHLSAFVVPHQGRAALGQGIHWQPHPNDGRPDQFCRSGATPGPRKGRRGVKSAPHVDCGLLPKGG